ncbi:hypothetical protein RB601_006571 [Gaeumannomyces tritici]
MGSCSCRDKKKKLVPARLEAGKIKASHTNNRNTATRFGQSLPQRKRIYAKMSGNANGAGDGPWIKQDPAQLKRDAESKEAKHARKEAMRKARAEARKEKRTIKAEAKRARKVNVKRAGKWTSEARKAEQKIKKAANRPEKTAKRIRRMGLRAEKLKAQAIKLMADAEKTKAAYEVLMKREQERIDKDKADKKAEGAERREAQGLGEGDFMSLDVDTDDEVAPPSKPAAKKGKVIEIESNDSDSSSGEGDSSEDESSEDESSEEEKPEPKSKSEPKSRDKAKSDPKPEPVPAAVPEEKKKSKKDKAKDSKKATEEKPTEAAVVEEQSTKHISKEAKKARKAEKKRKREEEEAPAASPDAEEEAAPKKQKKPKKDKKDKKDEDATPSEKPAAAAAQWNVDALEGGVARQSKFLKLLGGTKGDAASTATGGGSTAQAGNAGRSEADLLYQFDYGMKMKNEMGGQKRGLGA